MKSKSSIVLAIDPGYDRLGWAIGSTNRDKPQVIESGLITTPKNILLDQRYLKITHELKSIIKKHQPTQLAIETLFFSRNTTTALKVSEVRGVIISQAALEKLEIFEYQPNQIKQVVTGYGKADKKAVEKMIRLQLKLGSEQLMDDTTDALAILLTHSILNS